uniref:Uncharacterized protein n=1 Tax=Triticum urartu TaxID=4572 RepID=A0A8R7UTI2_TRIUA
AKQQGQPTEHQPEHFFLPSVLLRLRCSRTRVRPRPPPRRPRRDGDEEDRLRRPCRRLRHRGPRRRRPGHGPGPRRRRRWLRRRSRPGRRRRARGHRALLLRLLPAVSAPRPESVRCEEEEGRKKKITNPLCMALRYADSRRARAF